MPQTDANNFYAGTSESDQIIVLVDLKQTYCAKLDHWVYTPCKQTITN